jgi:hypothetical protein
MKKLEAVIPKILGTKKGRKAFNEALAKAFEDSKQQKRAAHNDRKQKTRGIGDSDSRLLVTVIDDAQESWRG